MKRRILHIALTFLLAVATIFGAARIVWGSGSTDIPAAYVISDGTDCYYIDFDDLVASYLVYIDDPDAADASLAKFYFSTTAEDVTSSFKAYVSGVTTKFVGFGAIMDKYIDTMNVNDTYIWFNSLEATPAFSAVTRVWVLGSSGGVTGRYYVNTNGYIIRRSTYTLSTSAPAAAGMNVPETFTLSVSTNDLGCDTLSGSLGYEITGGDYTLEYENGGVWETLSGGTIGSSASITPDWTASVNLRFTALGSGTYTLSFGLKTDADEVLAETSQTIAVTGAMQLTASTPTFRAGTPAQFTLSAVANGDAGKMAQIHFTVPAGVALEYLDGGTGDWLPLPAIYGPTGGFAVADATMTLRGTFSEAGTRTVTVQYIEADTTAVLASKDIEVYVEQPMEVDFSLPTFYAGEPESFTLTTTANDDAGKLVQAYFILPAGAVLEYWEEASGTWVPVSGGVYGPGTGFPAADATYTFRTSFVGIGMNTLRAQFVEVGTGAVLTEEGFVATVWEHVPPTIVVPGLKSITINADTTAVRVDLKNPSGNTCYFVIRLALDDETVLFTSGMLAPGEGVTEITLSGALSAGTYDAILRYDAYSAADLSPLNSAEVAILLIAQ